MRDSTLLLAGVLILGFVVLRPQLAAAAPAGTLPVGSNTTSSGPKPSTGTVIGGLIDIFGSIFSNLSDKKSST